VSEKSKSKPPSQEFVDAVTIDQSIAADCELCGRTCFEDSEMAGDWEPGELEQYRLGVKQRPDKFVAVPLVRVGKIAGKQVITTCPCNGLRSYEDFIWSHRHIIAKYLQSKTERIAQAAYDDEAEAEFVMDNVSREDANIKFSKCQGGCGGYFYTDSMDDRMFCPRCAEAIPPPEPEPEPSHWDDSDNLPF